MEKFFLCAILACDKLNVIDEQQVCQPVFVAKFLYLSGTDGVDQFVGEIFALDIDDAE